MFELQWIFLIFGAIFGAILGSFACCQAWRIRLQSEGRKLGNRSVCLYCGHRLGRLELIPIFSWLFLGGKCKKCKTKIGLMEFFSEITMALIFASFSFRTGSLIQQVLQHTGPLNSVPLVIFETIKLLLLFAIFTIMWILLVYDKKWLQLPVNLLRLLIILSGTYFLFNLYTKYGLNLLIETRGNEVLLVKNSLHLQDIWQYLLRDFLRFLGALLVLPGIYFVLYKFSRETLVGGGDFILLISVAFLLGRWELGVIELGLSNLLAAIANYRMLKNPKNRQPFGFAPYIILACMITLLFQTEILRTIFLVY
ncbi:prepilin peptidase [Candidatus Saccharibacteria bacterium]|nr:prepilin peptidase [Candidatus Saccharibacteria bacterium]